MGIVNRGFGGRRSARAADLPPGQHDVGTDFPVLSAGPTPRPNTAAWDFTVQGEVDGVRRWTWDEFRALPRDDVARDIHCVTSWTKFGTSWSGVSLDVLLDGVATTATHVSVFCDGGYTTDLPLDRITGGKAWVVDTYDGEPLAAEHGGPARLLVPDLYFWKSAKWVRGIELTAERVPGFWELLGYHEIGDPWREQRYDGD